MKPVTLLLFIWSVSIFRVNASLDVRVVIFSRNGEKSLHNGDSCGAGVLFEQQVDLSCACITGVWAFYGAWCSYPKIIMGGVNYCFQLPHGLTSQISLLSSEEKIFSSTLARMTPGFEQLKEKVYQDTTVSWDMTRSAFVTTGDECWQLRTGAGKYYCLRTSDQLDSYCRFSFKQFPEDLRHGNVTEVKLGCTAGNEIIIEAFDCSQHYRGIPSDERFCAEIDSIQLESSTRPTSYDSYEDSHNYAMEVEDTDTAIRMRHGSKRNKRAAPLTPATIGDEDDDWLDPAQSAVVNHPLVLQELQAYLDAEISGSAGTTTPFVANTRGIPVFTLLESVMRIFQRTCNVVKPSHFELAYNTFTNIQVQNYHLKEPYLSHPQFARIRMVLNQCYLNGNPYNFVVNETDANSTNSANNTCKEVELPKASSVVEVNKEQLNLTLEEDKRGHGYEPIVETVWKMFLNAHSYCYKYFPESYDDHHIFSEALLFLFTNEIQNIWFNKSFPDGAYVEPAEGLLLYGGTIGPHRPLMEKIDLCVAASQVDSGYPWLLKRPPLDTSNKWFRRRKRSLNTEPTCLKNPASLNTGMGFGGRCD